MELLAHLAVKCNAEKSRVETGGVRSARDIPLRDDIQCNSGNKKSVEISFDRYIVELENRRAGRE